MTMKKAIFIYSTLSLIGLGVYFLLPEITSLEKAPVYIALAAPLSGPDKPEGKEILKGVQLYLDQINKKGGIGGRKVKLRIFDDNGKSENSGDIASEIAMSKDILLVLGHFTSSASVVAGKIYKRFGVPAITASATAGQVTFKNDWYFRMISNDAFQGKFIANYICTVLKKTSASILFTNDSRNSELVGYFEREANKCGLEIKKKWSIDSDRNKLEKEIKKAVTVLRSVKQPGMIFIAAHAYESVKIITSLKHPGTNYHIIGPEIFADKSFISRFANYPQEQVRPGYYTDGIYGTSAFIFDLANKEAHQFRKAFVARYKEEPSVLASCYYDAVHVAVEAIKLSEIKGRNDIRKDRKEIRDILISMNSIENGIQGVTGYICFDKNGDINGQIYVGVYQNRAFFPAYSQYPPIIPEPAETDVFIENAPTDEKMLAHEKNKNMTQIVYAGIDINEISNLNISRSSYTLDFYLWFRFKGEFDDSNIEFTNAANEIKLDHPITETRDRDITVRAYHVKADFKSDFDFHAYPFGKQILRIHFHHLFRKKSKLIFVPDVLGLSGFHDKKNAGKQILHATTGWTVDDISLYQDILSRASDPDIPDVLNYRTTTSYSRFNAEIRIKRKGFSFVLRKFLPIILVGLTLYCIYFIPSGCHKIRIVILIGGLITTVLHHTKLLSDISAIGYFTAIEYACFTIYALIILSVLITISIFMLYKKGDRKK